MKILLLLLCWPLFALAEIYQWHDPQGQTHYADQSHPDARVVDIDPGYTFYRVQKVFDGDTVLLEDGRRIRLLGINTPEVQHRNRDADAGGMEAKQWLTQKLRNNRVRLVIDSEFTDKYGRTLAHLFTRENEHINIQLVSLGLAEVSIYPPNLLYSIELLAAQEQAEQQRLGIWGRPEYAPFPISQLDTLSEAENPPRQQWWRVQGRLQALRYTRKSVYLEFSTRFSARVERQWLELFPPLEQYVGKKLELRGWLNKHQDQFHMLLRHPSAIKVLS